MAYEPAYNSLSPPAAHCLGAQYLKVEVEGGVVWQGGKGRGV